MTKKDYEAIAEVFRNQKRGLATEQDVVEAIAGDFADVLQADNPRFNRARFLAACRGEDSQDSAGRTVRYSHSRERSMIIERGEAILRERAVRYSKGDKS
jgi:hypothetical protein